MSLKNKLKQNKLVRKIYFCFKNKNKFKSKYNFINRSKNHEKLCYILAGYKDFVWERIFERIEKFIDDDIDVCILSSGTYKQELADIAEKNNWSYLHTKVNNISIAQNILLREFKNATYIYKLDEDIFITKGYFKTLMKCLESVKSNGDYFPGIVAPLIPINGYGHVKILEKFNAKKTFIKLFEDVRYCAGSDRMIENNPEVAKFMWGEHNHIPQIDQMNYLCSKDKFNYSACPIRFSIGAILFERQIWENFRYFKVTSLSSCDLGTDESIICDYCIEHSRPIVVSHNCVVGHLSFGKQNSEMKNYFLNNQNKFKIVNCLEKKH